MFQVKKIFITNQHQSKSSTVFLNCCHITRALLVQQQKTERAEPISFIQVQALKSTGPWFKLLPLIKSVTQTSYSIWLSCSRYEVEILIVYMEVFAKTKWDYPSPQSALLWCLWHSNPSINVVIVIILILHLANTVVPPYLQGIHSKTRTQLMPKITASLRPYR